MSTVKSQTSKDILKAMPIFLHQRRLTQKQFAEKLSISANYISQILAEKRGMPKNFKTAFLSAYGYPIEEVPEKVKIDTKILGIIETSPAVELRDAIQMYESYEEDKDIKKEASVNIKEELSYLMKKMTEARTKEMIYYIADQLLSDRQKLLLLKYLHNIVLVEMVKERAEEEKETPLRTTQSGVAHRPNRKIRSAWEEKRVKQVPYNRPDKRNKTHLYI